MSIFFLSICFLFSLSLASNIVPVFFSLWNSEKEKQNEVTRFSIVFYVTHFSFCHFRFTWDKCKEKTWRLLDFPLYNNVNTDGQVSNIMSVYNETRKRSKKTCNVCLSWQLKTTIKIKCCLNENGHFELIEKFGTCCFRWLVDSIQINFDFYSNRSHSQAKIIRFLPLNFPCVDE